MIGHGYQRIETERPWVCPQLHHEINIHGSLQLKSGSPGLLSIMTLVEFKPTAKLDPTEILLVFIVSIFKENLRQYGIVVKSTASAMK